MNLRETLPTTIQERLDKQILPFDSQFSSLIGSEGYIPPENGIFIDAVAALSMGKNVLLKGPTGAGKTKFAETLSALFKRPMHMINCSVDMDAESLLGFKTLSYQDDKQVIDFVPGPVEKAMKNGHFLYIDEINMAKPETLPLINGVLDYRKTITNPFTSEVVIGAKGFGVVAAINEGYIGTVPLNEALKNRFVVIEVPYIKGEQLKRLIQSETELTDAKTIDLFVRFSEDLIRAANQGKISEDAASIRALLDTCDLAVLLPVERAIRRAITDKLEEQREKEIVSSLANTLF